MTRFTMVRWSLAVAVLAASVALCTSLPSASATMEITRVEDHAGGDGATLEWATIVDSIDAMHASLLEADAGADMEHEADVDAEADTDAVMDTEIEAELDAEAAANAEADVEAEAEVDTEANSEANVAPVKMAVASKGVSPRKPKSTLAAKPVPKKTAAARLTADEHHTKWMEFKKANPNKKYATSAIEQKAFNTFTENRAQIVANNDLHATNLNPKPFKSSGPHSDLTPAQFKTKYLRTRRGSGKATTTAPAKKTVAKAKARFMQLDSALEVTQADAGETAGRAGTAAGRAGTAAGSAGDTAGRAGTAAGRAGTAAGDAGGAAARAGTAAGQKVIVPLTAAQLAVAAKFAPYTGNPFNNPADTTDDERSCRTVSTVWFKRYAATPSQLAWQFGVPPAQKFIDNPTLLCTDTSDTTAGVLAYGSISVRSLLRDSFHDLMSHPADTPFMNTVISTSDVVLNQEQCGSCWAEAAIGSVEAALKKVNKYTAPLSVQQIIDCVKTNSSNGCAGGTPMDAISYLMTHPAATAAAYPYTGVQGTCRPVAPSGPMVGNWTFAWPNGSLPVPPCMVGACDTQFRYETDLMISVKTDGPFIAYVDATNWQNYGGGIYPPSQCSSTAEAGNHVVQLLGYGQQNGVPFWIVKNSWGPSWGENGLIKLAMGINGCGIANYVGRATL